MSLILWPLLRPLMQRASSQGVKSISGGGLGPELLVNGDFNAGAANWIVTNADATHIVTFDGATMRFQSDTTTPALNVSQPGVLVVGKRYRITVVVSAVGSGAIKSDSFSSANLVIATSIPGTYVSVGVAITASFSFTRNNANVDSTWDSVSIREMLQ